MWKQSVWSSAIAAALAANHLKAGGCVVLPGLYSPLSDFKVNLRLHIPLISLYLLQFLDKFLKLNYFLSGAKPALAGTPGMIGYGMAKAAVHQLVKSLSCPKSGLPEGAFCAGVKQNNEF